LRDPTSPRKRGEVTELAARPNQAVCGSALMQTHRKLL